MKSIPSREDFSSLASSQKIGDALTKGRANMEENARMVNNFGIFVVFFDIKRKKLRAYNETDQF